ncbi:MAG: ADP-forming succinate--CoA ligase subunit beta [Vicinamibacteria bacterium]|nr:ADP-forming succinate--CoA ligase subunit beta [Vicinamibacteria bacterium]
MNLHEYQAKAVFRSYGVGVPRGGVAGTPDEARDVARSLGGEVWAVKAQIHAGGRGKGGGIRLARSPDEVFRHAASMLGAPLVTHQTGVAGQIVRKLLVERGCEIEREHYLGVAIDRSTDQTVMLASREGGVEIEEVAKRSPEKILTEQIDPVCGLMPFQTRRIAFGLDMRGERALKRAADFMSALHRVFMELDCSIAEINPLVLTKNGELLALDAKLALDDSALYRHPDLAAMLDPEEEDPTEREAKESSLSYVSLDGNIGCMVNGAGLAMATMDIIKLHGGEPANFLDVGGGANTEQVKSAFKILLRDDKVRAVLINIFGGIMKCDTIAKGILGALEEVRFKAPLVARLEGTNVEIGREILARSGVGIVTAADMREAAQTVVRLAAANSR